MNKSIARILLAAFCLTAAQAYAVEADRQQAMSQACGFTAGRQQLHVTAQMRGVVPSDDAALARYREILRHSSVSARESARLTRPAKPDLVALDDASFNDAVNLGIVLQSDPALVALATARVVLQKPDKSRTDAQLLAELHEAWTSLCLEKLKAGSTPARIKELSLCNTFAVIALAQRQRLESTQTRKGSLTEKVSYGQIEAMLSVETEARAMINDTLALNWVDDEMRDTAILRAVRIAVEAPSGDVSRLRELAQQLSKDPLRLPFGSLCDSMVNGTRPVPLRWPPAALVEAKALYEIAFRPDLADFYPPHLALSRKAGLVTMQICFDDKGDVTRYFVKNTSGSEDLDSAAAKAARKYRFRPALVNFLPRAECVDVHMAFAPK